MHPRPGFSILGFLHLFNLAEFLESGEIRLKRAATKRIEMAGVHAVVVKRLFEEAGQPLVKPQRHRLEYAMKEGMGQFVTQIGSQMIA